MANIYEKLIKIQQELKAPKGHYNSFGKYYYRSCEDILEAVKPILAKYGCCLFISDHIENLGDRYYIEAEVTITDGSESVSVSAFAREDDSRKGMTGDQLTGCSSSYARKYALNGLFCIDDTKDADTDAYATATNASKSSSKATNNNSLICGVCGGNIVDSDGATAQQIATATFSKYGKCMCKNCIDKRNAETKK